MFLLVWFPVGEGAFAEHDDLISMSLTNDIQDNAKLYLQSLSTLKELCVVRCHLSSAERTKFVQKYSEACPSIREFDFWKEKWLARGQGGWERYFSQ